MVTHEDDIAHYVSDYSFEKRVNRVGSQKRKSKSR